MRSAHTCHDRRSHQWHVVLMLVLVLLGQTTAADPEQARRLAILVAAPWQGEAAMHNDLMATYDALRQRGFAPEEFLILAGPLTRRGLVAFLHDIHQRIASWPDGNVWFSFSGHGTFTGMPATEARPGLLFTSAIPPSYELQIFWDEVFAELQVPAAVQLTVLPDS
jgi:hypothetical protein